MAHRHPMLPEPTDKTVGLDCVIADDFGGDFVRVRFDYYMETNDGRNEVTVSGTSLMVVD